MKTRSLSQVAVLGILGCSLFYMACSDDSTAITEPPAGTSSGSTGSSGTSSGQTTSGDAGPINFDAGKDPETGAPKDCFDNPKTHFEIINGCTNADRIVRTTTSSKIFADGGVPTP